MIIFQQFPFPEASVWGRLYSYFGEGLLLVLFSHPYIFLSSHSLSNVRALHAIAWPYCILPFQSAPDASAAADIVYRHIPSALCVSEVWIHLILGFYLHKYPINVVVFSAVINVSASLV